ncbi:MAG TPA: MafI family immunity protein [Pyrinomonadaceae bacterium]|nr:MafI family immunity protein [Pyrinomonadaceae bacterium]
MTNNPVKRLFQRIFVNKSLEQIELLAAKARDLGLSEKDITEALINLEYNEFGLAFDIIVEQMYEFEIKIDQEFYDLAMDICETMKLDKDEYQYLKELISV